MTHRTFKISLLTATLISVGVLAGTASAERPQKDGAPRKARVGHYVQHNDVNQDGSVSVDEAVQTAETRFAEIDANQDGSVTPEEGKAAAQARHAQGAKHGQGRLTKMFQKMDKDADGKLTRAEVGRMPEKIFQAIDANDDGALTASEMETHKQARRAAHGQKFFERMDITGDGKISVHEAIDRAKQKFERLDANDDQIVTAEEARSAHGPRGHGKCAGGQKGKGGKGKGEKARTGTTA